MVFPDDGWVDIIKESLDKINYCLNMLSFVMQESVVLVFLFGEKIIDIDNDVY